MDPEIRAMQVIAESLGTLEKDAIQRVLLWAGRRFEVQTAPVMTPPPAAGVVKSDNLVDASTYSDYHDLIDAASPKDGLERILVTAYWFQAIQGQDNFESYQVNSELKNLGHPSANITRDLGRLMKKTPKLVLQVAKEGSTKQARKKYRLTREGIRYVDGLVAGQGAPLD